MNAREYEQRYEAERAALASQHDDGAAEALSRCLELDVDCMAYCYGGLAIVNIVESLADLAEQGWRLRREGCAAEAARRPLSAASAATEGAKDEP